MCLHVWEMHTVTHLPRRSEPGTARTGEPHQTEAAPALLFVPIQQGSGTLSDIRPWDSRMSPGTLREPVRPLSPSRLGSFSDTESRSVLRAKPYPGG